MIFICYSAAPLQLQFKLLLLQPLLLLLQPLLLISLTHVSDQVTPAEPGASPSAPDLLRPSKSPLREYSQRGHLQPRSSFGPPLQAFQQHSPCVWPSSPAEPGASPPAPRPPVSSTAITCKAPLHEYSQGALTCSLRLYQTQPCNLSDPTKYSILLVPACN